MCGRRVVAVSGGVGGAKLALGLYSLLPAGTLSVVVNTGDDFTHLGLAISPDVDTTLYTLAGLANPDLGWGRRDESWAFLETLESLGGETWFRLGDRDLALHVERTRRLAEGEGLGAIIADVARRWGIAADIRPMSDDRVATMVATDEGELAFQDYFVRRRCAPRVTGIRFAGAETARPGPGVEALITAPETEAILLCPSNPYLSLGPVLAVPGLRGALRRTKAPVIAVTPLIGGAAVKGPTAKIMADLGLEVSPLSVAAAYGDLLDGFLLDCRDAALAGAFALPVRVADTLMHTLDDRRRVAEAALDFARALAAAP
jgi:LPPG:FO 2-phospho-L-lactate transferase